MTGWQPAQYLRFDDERTRPCRDLVAQVRIEHANRIIDLGCGPGNSTAALAERWPDAEITGLDSSAAMLERAHQSSPRHRWVQAEIADWAATERAAFDAVVSNAALHWVQDHATLFPRLLARVNPGGALAVQMPANRGEAAQTAMRELARSAKWRPRFTHAQVQEWFIHETAFYYDVLAGAAAMVNLWETIYMHVLPDVESITEWYKGSSLKPYLDALATAEDRQQFMQDFTDAIRPAYPRQAAGRVLFPFRRLFLVATR